MSNQTQRTIWFLNHYAGNLTLGMEYRHYYLARYLKRIGYNVAIISGSFHHLSTHRPDVKNHIAFKVYDDIEFAFIKTRPYKGNGVQRLLGMIDYTRGVNKYLPKLQDKFGSPDIVIGSSPHPFVHYNLQRIKKQYLCPVFFEVRDLWPQMLIELGFLHKYHPLSLFFYYLEHQAYKKSDRTISLWNTADEYMFKHGLKPNKYIYLPNGIDIDESNAIKFNLDHPLCQKVLELQKQGKFIVGYGGSHGHANAIMAVVDACVYLKSKNQNDVVFICVGDGPEKEKFIQYAQNNSVLNDNLYFYDYVTKDVVLGFYKLINVTYIGLVDLPLFKYGPTPNKLMDYFSMAKPIIYAIKSRFDPVKTANAGLSIKPCGTELANAIVSMKSLTSDELAQMGMNGRLYAERELSFDALARELSSHIEAVLSQK